MGIALDILFGGVFAAALIFGLIKGFAKQFGTVTTLFGAFICAIVVSGILLPYFMNDVNVYLTVKNVGTWFYGMPGADTPVASAEELAAVLSSSAFNLFSSSAESVWETMNAYYIFTVGEYVGYLIVQVVSFLILLLIFYSFFANVLKAVSFFLYSLSKTFVAIDKLLGGIWTVLLVYVLVVCFLMTGLEITLGLHLPEASEGFLALVSQSSVLSLAHNTNFIGAIVANLFGYTLPPLVVVA